MLAISRKGAEGYTLEVYVIDSMGRVTRVGSRLIAASLLGAPIIADSSMDCNGKEDVLIPVVVTPIEPIVKLPVWVYVYALSLG